MVLFLDERLYAYIIGTSINNNFESEFAVIENSSVSQIPIPSRFDNISLPTEIFPSIKNK